MRVRKSDTSKKSEGHRNFNGTSKSLKSCGHLPSRGRAGMKPSGKKGLSRKARRLTLDIRILTA
ncbi:MAG: hypothetical protein LBR80_08215 [Deltaproteobacteria bacterium]|nr:hypothetical protein [Deltaproteobacteria bacterium]